MIDKTSILVTDCVNPHENLAVEEALLRNLPENQAVLFLWQNKHTVVIGAGQNAWSECHTELLKKEGGTLARRSTGGGAVYHDLGNLNFSFIVPRADYDVERQLRVVLRAVNSLGIAAEATGRNDLTASGRKFSGNAFRLLKESALHHGTLLCAADMEKIGRYLNVSAEKLKAKGVKSVPSRVVNLSELAPVSVEDVKCAMVRAFADEYGEAPVTRTEDEHIAGLSELLPKYESWSFNYGSSPAGELHLSKRFDWGMVELYATLREGKIGELSVYSDAMDETLHLRLHEALNGCLWRKDAIAEKLGAVGLDSLTEWLENAL